MREHVPSGLRAAVLFRDRHRCVICGSTEELAIDHVHPVAEGGVSRIENLQTLCKPCNTSKKDRDGHEWLSSGMWRRRFQPRTPQPRVKLDGEPASFRHVIDLWPTMVVLAADLGLGYEAVNQWRKRDSIPTWVHARLLQAAHARGFEKVTRELLDELTERRIADRKGAA